MKTIIAIAALAVLASAGPAKHRRGACPAKANKTYGGDDSTATKDYNEPAKTDDSDAATGDAVCPADGGKTLKYSGSCACDYSINCASKADHGDSTKFWERTHAETILSLTECVSICDENADCAAVIWVDDSTASSNDYHRCWQTSGLGGIIDSGYGQISYKGACSGTCAETYMNLQ